MIQGIPKVRDLELIEPSSADYAPAIDVAFLKLDELKAVQLGRFDKVARGIEAEYVKQLGQVEGARIIFDKPLIDRKFRDDQGRVNGRQELRAIALESTDPLMKTTVSRKLADISAYTERKLRSAADRSNDGLRDIRRAREDFMEKALALTEVKEVSRKSPMYELTMFFIPRGEEVYEAHTKLSFEGNVAEFSVVDPVKREHLQADWFRPDACAPHNLWAQSQNQKVNVYFVTNPCSQVGVEDLFVEGALGHLNYVEGCLQKAGVEYTKKRDSSVQQAFKFSIAEAKGGTSIREKLKSAGFKD